MSGATEPSSRFGPAYEALAAHLRAERDRQGLTQRQLARNIEGYSTSLCNWEKGHSVPGIAAMDKWAAGLGLKLALVPVGDDHDEQTAAVRQLLTSAEKMLGNWADADEATRSELWSTMFIKVDNLAEVFADRIAELNARSTNGGEQR